MTQEQKDLLLKDLCARLPYGVKMNHIADNENSPKILIGIAKNMITLQGLGGYECVDVDHYKPYLFPLSSMTEDQRNEYHNLCSIGVDECGDIIYFDTYESIDYLNKNYFDYRGFIPKGWAKDATGLNIY